MLVLLLLGTAAGLQAATLDYATGTTIDPKPLIAGGYCSRWNFRINRLAYMAPDARGFYRVFTCRPDGSDRRDVSGNPALPGKHIGLPYCEPSGRYLLVAAEKEDWRDVRMFGSPDYGALPGFGVHDDLWVIKSDGSGAWKLTNEPNVKTEGEFIPVFSPDGRRVAWSSRQADKTYIIKVADFVEKPEPHLENVTEYQPGEGRITSWGRLQATARGSCIRAIGEVNSTVGEAGDEHREWTSPTD